MDNSQHFAGVNLDNISETASSQEDPKQQTQEQTRNAQTPVQTAEEAIAELEKFQKIKFEGREWTPNDLKKAILRQEDYSRKTQALAKERQAFEEKKKFDSNLSADLELVKNNPHMAAEFVKIYPKEYHQYLQQVLSGTQGQVQTQNQQQQGGQDVELLSRLHQLESTLMQQEVAKNETVIERELEKNQAKYPDALPELVIARVYDAHSKGIEVTSETWEKTFKQVDAQMKDIMKARYSEFVKKQTEANQKAKDVSGGGGTVGRAPQKFKSLRDVTDFAVKDLTGRE